MAFLENRPRDHPRGARDMSATSSAQAEAVSSPSISRSEMIQSLLANEMAASARTGDPSPLSLCRESAVLATMEKMSDEELAFCMRLSAKKDSRQASTFREDVSRSAS